MCKCKEVLQKIVRLYVLYPSFYTQIWIWLTTDIIYALCYRPHETHTICPYMGPAIMLWLNLFRIWAYKGQCQVIWRSDIFSPHLMYICWWRVLSLPLLIHNYYNDISFKDSLSFVYCTFYICFSQDMFSLIVFSAFHFTGECNSSSVEGLFRPSIKCKV